MHRKQIVLLLFGSIALIILYLPMLLVLLFSFNSASRGMMWESFSIKWYQSVWSDRSILSAVKNTVVVASGTGLVSLVGGLVAGYAVGTARGRVFALSLPLLLIPAIMPDLVLALAQALLYGLIGFSKGLTTIVLSQATFGIAYVALFVVVRIKGIPYRGYVVAAKTLGATPYRVVSDHFLPLALPAATAGAAVVIAMAAQDFVYAFFCGGTSTTTVSVRIYSMVKFGVNSSVNVVYVILAGLALFAYAVSEMTLNQKRA